MVSIRGLVISIMLSYICWIAIVHRQLSQWTSSELSAVLDPLERYRRPGETNTDFKSTFIEDGSAGTASHQFTRAGAMMQNERNMHESSERKAKATKLTVSETAVENSLASTAAEDRQSIQTEHEFSAAFLDRPPCDPLHPDDIDFTLVTQCDEERIHLVAQHCRSWRGPLSVAVYSDRSTEEIVRQLGSLGCSREQVVISTLPLLKLDTEDSYPVNRLRNIAIRNTETTHILYLDIDFLPSDELESTLQTDAIRAALSKDHKLALVIPAFEYKPKCQNCNQSGLLTHMPWSRYELTRLQKSDEITMFHEYWPGAHDSTDYKAWEHQEHGSLIPIPCIKSNHYEPYLVLRKCQDMPPFQEAFTGYGYNKVTFTLQLQAMQYHFSQVGGVFCVHLPHPASKTRQRFAHDMATGSGRHQKIVNLVKNYMVWLHVKFGHVLPDMAPCHDMTRSSALPHKVTENLEYPPTESDHDSEAIVFLTDSQKLGICHHVTPDEVSFSLVTQCSDDRLWMMEHHCKRWGVNNSRPSISLLVYTNDTLADVQQKLRRMNCPVDQGMTVQVFRKFYRDQDYLVNHFRNEAFAVVATTHAVYVDIDFWPSIDLFSTLNSALTRNILSESVRNSIVIPAFQLHSQCEGRMDDCPEQHVPLMPFEKESSMLSLLSNDTITIFHVHHFPQGHSSTSYDMWMEPATDRMTEIRCVKSNRYEPYLVVRVCRDLPPFQTAFFGYGKNKISWIIHLRRLGWRFFQIGNSFIIHYPHKESKAKKAWKERSIEGPEKFHNSNTSFYKDTMKSRNERYHEKFKVWLNHSVPDQTLVHKCPENVSVVA